MLGQATSRLLNLELPHGSARVPDAIKAIEFGQTLLCHPCAEHQVGSRSDASWAERGAGDAFSTADVPKFRIQLADTRKPGGRRSRAVIGGVIDNPTHTFGLELVAHGALAAEPKPQRPRAHLRKRIA